MSRAEKELGLLSVAEVQSMIKGSLHSVVQDRNYFYHSSTGPNYSHLTEEGQEMLIKSMNVLLPLLADAEQRDIDRRAKQITFDMLKEQHDK
jgi:hypothetical protein